MSREGVIIQVKTDDGYVGIGEAAPLPGLSPEPLKKALHQIKSLRQKLIGLNIESFPPRVMSSPRKRGSQSRGKLQRESTFWIPALRQAQDVLRLAQDRSKDREQRRTSSKSGERSRTTFAGMTEGLVSSVRFGIEMAVLHAVAQSKKSPLAEILGCAHIKDVATAGLLQGTLEEIKRQAERLVSHGHEVFKLKVGNKNIPLDVKKVEVVRAVIGPRRALRLDANRTWGLKEAVAFGQNIGREGIEFMEEPLNDLSDLAAFVRATKLPVALDESLHDLDPRKASSLNGVEFLVIKPTIMGGLIKTLDWIAEAARVKKNVVISSSFESSIGMTALANLATFTAYAAGLGTSGWLKEDLMHAPLIGPNGAILKKSLQFGVEDIKMEHLIKIKE